MHTYAHATTKQKTGFLVLDALARRNGAPFAQKREFDAQLASWKVSSALHALRFANQLTVVSTVRQK
jgi:hypothetical protein